MGMVNRRIENLLTYGQKELYLSPEGKACARNRLLELMQTEPTFEEYKEEDTDVDTVLAELTEYAVQNGIVDEELADKFPDKLMSFIVPSQDDVARTYSQIHLEKGRGWAESYFRKVSVMGKFVKTFRPGSAGWYATGDNGDFAVLVPSEERPEATEQFYPKCPYCLESVGFCGLPGEDSCYNKRVIPFEIGPEKWYFSYLQRQYFEDEYVVSSEKHRPSGSGRSIAVMADIAEKVPTCFVTTSFEKQFHEHFYGGGRSLKMFERPDRKVLFDGDYKVSIVDWNYSTLRIKCYIKPDLIRTVPRVIKYWRDFAEGNIVYPAVYCTDKGYFADLVCLKSGTPNILFEKPDAIAAFGMNILPSQLKRDVIQLKDELIAPKIDFEKIHRSPELSKYLEWAIQIAAARGTQMTDEQARKSIVSMIGETCIETAKSFSLSDEQLETIYNETLKDYNVNQ